MECKARVPDSEEDIGVPLSLLSIPPWSLGRKDGKLQRCLSHSYPASPGILPGISVK